MRTGTAVTGVFDAGMFPLKSNCWFWGKEHGLFRSHLLRGSVLVQALPSSRVPGSPQTRAETPPLFPN